MHSSPPPDNEAERQRKLDELDILDTVEELAYDDLTLLAAQICGTPVALVSLIDRDRQWFKSHHGLNVRETPRNVAYCAHAIHSDELLIVEDATRDQRFHDNPLATGYPHVRFYAGAPLVLEHDVRLGTLCVIDHQPRTLTETQKLALAALARQVVAQLQLRLQLKEQARLEQTKDDFIAMVSHEMRTPLTAINGALSLLLNEIPGALNEQTRNLVDIGHRNANRLLTIVNDILDVTKINAGKLELSFQVYNIYDLLRQALSLNQPLADRQRCTLQLRSPAPEVPLRVNCDQYRINQVLTNFISNAVKFTHPGDTIYLDVARSSDRLTVTVEDHGPGVPADRQHLLFRKFSQLKHAQGSSQPGTGLGLVICQHLIELHQGSIGFESIPEVHTRFYFSLPLAD